MDSFVLHLFVWSLKVLATILTRITRLAICLVDLNFEYL